MKVAPSSDELQDRCRSLAEGASILARSRLYAANAASSSSIDEEIHRAAGQAVGAAAAVVALEKGLAVRCSFLECDSPRRPGCSVGVAATLGDNRDEEGSLVGDRAGPRG